VSARDEGWQIPSGRFRAEVWVTNDEVRPLVGVVSARLVDAAGREHLARNLAARAPAESSVAIGELVCDLPTGQLENPLVLALDLRVGGKLVSRQRLLYTTGDFRDAFRKSGPRLAFGPVRVTRQGSEAVVAAEVRNVGRRTAIGVGVGVAGVAPERVRHDDDRFILLPGEAQRVTLRIDPADLASPSRRSAPLRLEAEAWNCNAIRHRL